MAADPTKTKKIIPLLKARIDKPTSYKTKPIQYSAQSTMIIVHEQHRSSMLIALFNLFLLRRNIELQETTISVSVEDLNSKVEEHIRKVLANGDAANDQIVSRMLDDLQALETENLPPPLVLDVDGKACPGAARELITTADMGQLIRNFLNNYATQLATCSISLCIEKGLVPEGQPCVFFGNNLFSTMLKHDGELYELVTDKKYRRKHKYVWKGLNKVDGARVFWTGDFEDSFTKKPKEYLAGIQEDSENEGVEAESNAAATTTSSPEEEFMGKFKKRDRSRSPEDGDKRPTCVGSLKSKICGFKGL